MDSSCSRMMKIRQLCCVLVLLFSHSSSSEAKLWSWLGLEPAAVQPDPPCRERHCYSSRSTDLVKFDIETERFLSNSRGKDLVDKARQQTAKHSCWNEAYTSLLSSCRELLKEEDKKARLAMRLTNCFLKVSERDPIHCPNSVPISKCTSGLSDHINSIFLAFFIDAASMCHHLQSEAFKQETEHVINELKGSAHWVEEKLKTMESQTDAILQQTDDVISEQKLLHTRLQEHSKELVREYHRLHSEMRERIQDGLSGIDLATTDVREQLQGVGFLQKEMSHHQNELAENQKQMGDSLSIEFRTLHDKTHEISNSMTEEFSNLKKKSHVIADSLAREFASLHQKSHEIADSLTTEFSSLHDKTHEIDNGVQRSLTGQQALLHGQVQAVEGLHNLKKLQEDAFKEGRASMLELTHEAKMHQQDFLAWQIKLHNMHQQLERGSNAMLEAQEAFVSKQTAVFASLERLFSLHNAILLESRALKTFLFYVATSIFVYLSTSAKQTLNARPLLYCSLLFTFALELWIIRNQTTASRGFHQILSSLLFPRLTFGVTTIALLLYYIVNYRDFTALSYDILVDLQDRLKALPPSSPCAIEEVSLHSSVARSKITRITNPYEKALAKKIVRRARACRSHPITWLMACCSPRICKAEPHPTSLNSYFDAQRHLDDEDPDYKPPLDPDGTMPSLTHNYNLRPRRRSRLCPAGISSPQRQSVDPFRIAVNDTS